jgi:hypothetical protein
MQIQQLGLIVKQLLQRHSMVILPGFGGLVCERVPARLDAQRGRLTPPMETILFNAQLKHNDGLLIQTLATSSGLSLKMADAHVTDAINEMRFLISKGESIELADIGTFRSTVEGHVHFVPDAAGMIAMASFGLKTLQLAEILQRKDFGTEALQSVRALPVGRIVAYAAAAMLAGALIWLPFQERFVSNGRDFVSEMGILPVHSERAYAPRSFSPLWDVEQTLEDVVVAQEADVDLIGFSTTIPEENVGSVRKQEYLVIAAVYADKASAEAFSSKLRSRGFESEYAGQASNGAHMVAYGTYSSLADAEAMLASVRMTNKEAHLLMAN